MYNTADLAHYEKKNKPGQAEHKGTVGISPTHILAATFNLILPGGRLNSYTHYVGISQLTLKSFRRAWIR